MIFDCKREINDFEKFDTSGTVNVNHDLDYFGSSEAFQKFIDGISGIARPSAMNRQPVHF